MRSALDTGQYIQKARVSQQLKPEPNTVQLKYWSAKEPEPNSQSESRARGRAKIARARKPE